MLFQSTPSYEGEHTPEPGKQCLVDFNPLPHTRENNMPDVRTGSSYYFNPLPHTRENSGAIQSLKTDKISIHSLIRGRTKLTEKEWKRLLISIHSLIRGRTLQPQRNPQTARNFNPLPRKRENNTLPSRKQLPRYFNPLPHTRDKPPYIAKEIE